VSSRWRVEWGGEKEGGCDGVGQTTEKVFGNHAFCEAFLQSEEYGG
jgi:hypothetical protein